MHVDPAHVLHTHNYDHRTIYYHVMMHDIYYHLGASMLFRATASTETLNMTLRG